MLFPGRSKVVFESTRKEDSATNNIIGIDPDLNTSGGYDGDFPEDGEWDEEKREHAPLTMEERRELALHMLRLWERYHDKGREPSLICPLCETARGRL